MIQFFIKHSKELTMAGALAVLTICYFQQRELTTLRAQINSPIVNVDSLVKVNDSLSNEQFQLNIDLGRYKGMWGIFSEENPTLAEKIEHEVE